MNQTLDHVTPRTKIISITALNNKKQDAILQCNIHE